MPTEPNRPVWGTLVVLTLLWIGLVDGTALGAVLTPKGSGLAGPAIALGYGVAAAVGAGATGGLLAWKLSSNGLRLVGLVTGAISLILLGLVFWRVAMERAEHGI